MNASEGLTRVATVVRWLGYLASVGVLVLAAFILDRQSGIEAYVGLLAMVVLFGGGGWTLAWIIEGFAKPKA